MCFVAVNEFSRQAAPWLQISKSPEGARERERVSAFRLFYQGDLKFENCLIKNSYKNHRVGKATRKF